VDGAAGINLSSGGTKAEGPTACGIPLVRIETFSWVSPGRDLPVPKLTVASAGFEP